MKMKTPKIRCTVLLALSLGAGVFVGCSGGDADGVEVPSERAYNVRVLDLEPSTLKESILISGPIRPVRGTDISTQESGVIQSLPADKGSVVKKGDVIVLLDRRVLESEMKSAESARVLREYNEERTRRLFEANSVSNQEMLRVYTELQQAGEAERVAQLRYERAAIKSPFDGMVADRYVEVGELVSPGARVARIVDPFTVKLVGSVTDRGVAWVREGAPAEVNLDGSGGVLEGVVSYVGIEANPLNGKFTVEVEIDNSGLALRAGVVARARIRKAVHEGALVIPRDALVQTLDGLRVYVAEGDRAAPRAVELGATQGLMVAVVRGLEAGDRVVVRGQRQLQPGSLISIREVATARDGSLAGDPPEIREASPGSRLPDELAGDTEALK